MFGVTTTVLTKDGQVFTRKGPINAPPPRHKAKACGQVLVFAAAATVFIVAMLLGLGKLFSGLLLEQYQFDAVVNGTGYVLLAFMSLWVGERFIERLSYVAADYRRRDGEQPRPQQQQNQPRRPEDGRDNRDRQERHEQRRDQRPQHHQQRDNRPPQHQDRPTVTA